MLVFPQWRYDAGDGCRVQRWMPAERFAPYLARPVISTPPQIEDEDSSGSSSHDSTEFPDGGEHVCAWRACGARFQSIARLSAHVARTHAHAHADGLFYCAWKDCSRPQRGFNARYKMLVHVRTHTNERPHTCNQCNKSFSRAENLKIHLRSHSGEKPYVCPYEGCGKAYSNSSDRFKHTRTHTVDKPYCCKLPGCNKRYTDPSSLRKHVKTYKHFAREETPRESSEEIHSPAHDTEPTSPGYSNYTPPRDVVSPSVPYPILLREPSISVGYPIEQVTYIKPLEPIYPMRIPPNEMSYIEYSQMYDHTYRSYYSNSINYPVLTQSASEKAFRYEELYNDVPMTDSKPRYEEEEMPLNLICAKQRIECKPIEDLVRRSDLPLDLSTKS